MSSLKGRLFSLGDKVVDRDGWRGTVVKVIEWRESVWYEVRFGRSGVAVRYNSDLTKDLHP